MAIDRFGGPKGAFPFPEVEPSEVLIALHTARVGRGMWTSVPAGGPSASRDFPIVLGTHRSGTVAAIGSRVRRFQRGDKGYAYGFGSRKGGVSAEYAVVAAENVAPLPEPVDMGSASAIGTTGLTMI